MAKIINGVKKIELTENEILEPVGCKDFGQLEKYYNEHIKTDSMPEYKDTDWHYKLKLGGSIGFIGYALANTTKELQKTLQSTKKL